MAAPKILLIDSGVGGLTICASISRRLPDADLIMVADSAFFPYGNKTAEQIRERVTHLATTLVAEHKPDVLILACNTATVYALQAVRQALDLPVIGTIPSVKPAARASLTGVVGVLATPATVQGAFFHDYMKEHAGDVEVLLHGTVELVALAEQKLRGSQPSPEALLATVQPLFDRPNGDKMDVAVLGCTHFPILRPELIAMAPTLHWIDSGEAIARRAAQLLGRNTINVRRVERGQHWMLFTDPARTKPIAPTALVELGLPYMAIQQTMS